MKAVQAGASAQAESQLARDLRVIEFLKADLAAGVAAVYRAMARVNDEAVSEALASVVVGAYVLARRLGISPARLDMKVESRVRSAMAEPHELEQWYGDFSALYRHFQGGGRR
ncbi:MAG TPA: MazG-like family protein [Limnochordales bacterium]